MPSSLTANRAAQYFLIAIAGCLIISVARTGVAAYYFSQNSPTAVQKSIAWDPGNPIYPATAANLIHLYSDNPDPDAVIQLYQTALRLSPFDAGYSAELAQAYERAGRSALALPLYQQAQLFFANSPEINWKLANFYVRSGKPTQALPALKKALSSGAVAKDQIFALTSNARVDNTAVLNELLPPDSLTVIAYLNFQVAHGHLDAAQQTWDHLLRLGSPFEINEAFPYLDGLIKSRDVDRARQAWAALAQRFPSQISTPSASNNLVTNGNFQSDILNGGFDWRVFPVAGASITQGSIGTTPDARGVRIDFDGSQNVSYDHFFQFVPVQPNTRYDFSAALRCEAITTDSGAGLEVSDPSDGSKVLGRTDTLTGTESWSEHKFSFTTGPDTHLVEVIAFRWPSTKFDNKIAGAFSISQVSITAHP
jgi:tetratricopeptide (TPR) repeat protein